MQCFEVGKAFSFIKRSGFLFYGDVWMGFQKILAVKDDIPDNAEFVSNDVKFISITVRSIDVPLLDGWICGCVGRHRTIGCFIRVIGIAEVMGLFKNF